MASREIFTDEQYKRLSELAQRRGFQDVGEYLLMLVEADAHQHGVALEEEDEIDDDMSPQERFRRGWADIMEGRVMSVEEYRKALEEDDEATGIPPVGE